MDKSPHCALSGEGALEFARAINFDETVDPEELRGDYPYQKITNVRNQNFDDYAGVIFAGQPVQNVDTQRAHDNAGAETAGVVEERQDDQAHDTVGAEVVGELGERMDEQAHDTVGAEVVGELGERMDEQAHDTVDAEVVGELGERMDEQAHDTVGAVAIDREGFLACANSTGIDTLASHFVNTISD